MGAARSSRRAAGDAEAAPVHAQERRRTAFVAANCEDLHAGAERGDYCAMVVTRPSCRGTAPPDPLQLCQRRLAFALSLVGDGCAWADDADVVELVGAACLLRICRPARLAFTAAGAGYDITRERGALASTTGNPQWALASCSGYVMVSARRWRTDGGAADTAELTEPSEGAGEGDQGGEEGCICWKIGGRSAASFEIVSQSDPVMVGLALRGADTTRQRAQRTGEFWGLGSNTGKLCHGGRADGVCRESWPGMECFGSGDVITLILDHDAGSLYARKNGMDLGMVTDYGVSGELCWAVALGGTASGGGDGSVRAGSQSQVRITALQAVGPDTN